MNVSIGGAGSPLPNIRRSSSTDVAGQADGAEESLRRSCHKTQRPLKMPTSLTQQITSGERRSVIGCLFRPLLYDCYNVTVTWIFPQSHCTLLLNVTPLCMATAYAADMSAELEVQVQMTSYCTIYHRGPHIYRATEEETYTRSR